MRGTKILIVDDDADVLRLVVQVFSEAGAEVYAASDGREGLRQFGRYRPDLVLLDVMMSGLDGWQMCRRIRRTSEVPIIFLTAVSQEEDVVRGLDCGAVDYVTKPFSSQVLLARARAAVRAAGGARPEQRMTHYDDGYLSVDLEKEKVCVAGVPAQLTGTEYQLFACLFENAGRVLTYRQILDQVWGWGYQDSTDYVHVYVYHLRRKLERDPERPKYVRTERRVGYCFETQSSSSKEVRASRPSR